MSVLDVIGELEGLLPILASIAGHPELGPLAQRLVEIGEDEIARRRSDTNRSRTEVLADAEAAYAEAQVANATLKGLGHEND